MVIVVALLAGLLGCSGPTAGPAAPSPSPGIAEVSFTGHATDLGYDRDGDGLFEFLQVNVPLEVFEAGWFGITAALTTRDGTLVAIGGLTPDLFRTAPVASTELEAGAQVLAIYFDGRAVRASGADGPYEVSVGLSGATGLLTAIDLDTGRYQHVDFLGPLIEAHRIRDEALDTDAISGYNLLRVVVDFNHLAAGQVTFRGQLFAGSVFVMDASVTLDLPAGGQTVNLDFDGLPIAGSGLDGPYTVYLSCEDAYSSSNPVHETQAYRHGEFQVPGALFTGSVADSGVDANGNGRFEQLRVRVELVATVPGRYILGGVLRDGAGREIEVVQEEAVLGIVPAEVELVFEGTAIQRRGADGPYQVHLALTDAGGNELMCQEFTTSRYSSSDLEVGR